MRGLGERRGKGCCVGVEVSLENEEEIGRRGRLNGRCLQDANRLRKSRKQSKGGETFTLLVKLRWDGGMSAGSVESVKCKGGKREIVHFDVGRGVLVGFR